MLIILHLNYLMINNASNIIQEFLKSWLFPNEILNYRIVVPFFHHKEHPQIIDFRFQYQFQSLAILYHIFLNH